MGDVTNKDTGVSEELVKVTEETYGPRSTLLPHVRLPFPLLFLPKVLKEFVKEASEAMGVAHECIATHAIATCAAAIGNSCRIKVNETWEEPAVIWAVTLMESGSLKTPAYNAAFEPLKLAQRLKEDQFHQDQITYKKDKAEFDALTNAWRNASVPEPSENALQEPVPPKPVDLFTSDSTVEALAVLFERNPRGLAFTRDELSGFFKSFGAYKGGRGGDESQYLEMYSAGTIKLDRAGGKRICVDQAALSIFGTCQPAVFRNVIGMAGRGSDQVENGLASRFLIAAPETRPIRWRKSKGFEKQPYYMMILDLLNLQPKSNGNGHFEPNIIPLLPEAEECFGPFINEHNEFAETIKNDPTRYHYRKLSGIAARLALIFCLCDAVTKQHDDQQGVQKRHVQAGITVARWYGREAWRFYESCEVQASWEQQLLAVIRKLGGIITPTQMHDISRKWRKPEAAEEALRVLEQAGYGELKMVPAGPRGGRQSLQFRLNDNGAVRSTREIPENTQLTGQEASDALVSAVIESLNQ